VSCRLLFYPNPLFFNHSQKGNLYTLSLSLFFLFVCKRYRASYAGSRRKRGKKPNKTIANKDGPLLLYSLCGASPQRIRQILGGIFYIHACSYAAYTRTCIRMYVYLYILVHFNLGKLCTVKDSFRTQISFVLYFESAGRMWLERGQFRC
jgi:hypothetical protein